ncbi:hypothetical protein LWF15_28030 [Kineosporia rhizophila]|uniref:hypothetical protein n=1 Tax=Kineosporia rhizophila TaxID=84633 RepID=UPI001E2F6667|nr:hypothetical protein [Kineosporia rhizophila]MCE0539353.1 hypothetical protein [Kineosporia rhizophila]
MPEVSDLCESPVSRGYDEIPNAELGQPLRFGQEHGVRGILAVVGHKQLDAALTQVPPRFSTDSAARTGSDHWGVRVDAGQQGIHPG